MSKGEGGRKYNQKALGLGVSLELLLWNLDLILSELEDFEQKRHDHEHMGGMSLKDHSGSRITLVLVYKWR